jgi:uncharacterized protein (DUF305 family)
MVIYRKTIEADIRPIGEQRAGRRARAGSQCTVRRGRNLRKRFEVAARLPPCHHVSGNAQIPGDYKAVMKTTSWRAACVLITAATTVSCSSRSAPAGGPAVDAVEPAADGPRIVQPGQPGEASRVIGDAATARGSALRHTAADVRFVQGMIAHHAQAIVMSELAPSRVQGQDVLMLARRIAISQLDEITLMQQWLRQRGESVPDPAHHMHGEHAHGHGMLTEQELASLAAASGVEFERLFLQFMIRHHEGALVMVSELFASPGAAQDTDVFRLASEVDTDQRIEIARMQAMLSARH